MKFRHKYGYSDVLVEFLIM